MPLQEKVGADIVIGIAALALHLCCAGVAGLSMFAVGLITQGEFGSSDAAELSEHATPLAVAGSIMLLGSLMMVAAGIGIIASKKWGFILAAVGVGVLLISWIVSKVTIPSLNTTQTEQMLDLVSDIIFIASCLFFGIYSALRLGGTIGPKPT